MYLSKSYEKITLYKILLKNIFFGIFAEFRQYFGEVSHSAKCRFGEVSFRQSGFRRSVTDPWRTLTCLTRAPKCVHSVFNAPVTRVELFRNVKDIRTRHTRLLEKILSMFKMFEPKRAESAHRPLATYVNVHPAYTKRTLKTHM